MNNDESLYTLENYLNNPKEQFVFLTERIKKLKFNSSMSILDLGCARGEFLYYVSNQIKFEKLVGIDISDKLINLAKENKLLPKIDFYRSDVLDFKIESKFDIITISGLVSYLNHNQLKKLLKNTRKHLKTKGYCLLFGIFNENKIDVLVKYKNSNDDHGFKNGRNSFSISTVKEICNSLGMRLKLVDKFELSIDLKKTKDLERNWTVDLDGKKLFMNGMGQIFNLYCLLIENDK